MHVSKQPCSSSSETEKETETETETETEKRALFISEGTRAPAFKAAPRRITLYTRSIGHVLGFPLEQNLT